MRLPLPLDTKNLMTSNELIKKTTNLGLLFNKYVSAWSDDWTNEERRGNEKVNLKSKFLDRIEKESTSSKEGRKYVDALLKRQSLMRSSLQNSNFHVYSFEATTDSRLIIGLGGTSVIETGMTLHPLYGFPYLPGSALKGLARAYAEIGADASKDELLEVFGSEDKNPHNVTNNRQGKVFFMDGLPTQFPKLELDIMNPHYGKYYQGEKDSKGYPIPPADYLDPVPVTFLAVAAGQKFSFVVYSRNKDLTGKAKEWLIGGLSELGAGGKTNVGYGYFKDFRHIAIELQTDKSEKPKEVKDEILSRVKAIKNNQTFVEFIKGIKENEIESLKGISFIGMESVINIGLVGFLESAEASLEVKQIIAQKMLEVINPNKNWDEKKHEKFRKLQLLAGTEKD
jgi:CRISPR-associated protein Cmr6